MGRRGASSARANYELVKASLSSSPRDDGTSRVELPSSPDTTVDMPPGTRRAMVTRPDQLAFCLRTQQQGTSNP